MPRQIKDLANYNFRPANFRDMLVVAKMSLIFGAQTPDMGVYADMFINALREQGFDPGANASFPWYPDQAQETPFREWVAATFVKPTQAHLNQVLDGDEAALRQMQPLRSPSSAVGKAMLMATGQFVAKERKVREPKAAKPPKEPKLGEDGLPVKRGRKPRAQVTEAGENTTPVAAKTKTTVATSQPSKTAFNADALKDCSTLNDLCLAVLTQIEPKISRAWAKHTDNHDQVRSALIRVAYAQVIMKDEAKLTEFMQRPDVIEAQENLASVHWKVSIGSVDPSKENLALDDTSEMPSFDEVEDALNQFQRNLIPGQKVPAHLKGTPTMSVISAYEWLKGRDSSVRPFYDVTFLRLIAHKMITDHGLMPMVAPHLANMTPDDTEISAYMIQEALISLPPVADTTTVETVEEEATAE